MPDNTPARIDRTAIERIIQRATELQTGERDISDGLTADEVVTLGKEVGIPERYLQQAMLEERSRAIAPLAPSGFLDKAIGPGVVRAERVVRGEVERVEQRLVGYLDDNELFTIQRQQPGRISWEPLRGMQGALRRSSAIFQGNRPFMLSRVTLLSATVLALEPGFCHVALAAELKDSRSAYLGGGLALASLGAAGAVIFFVLSPFAYLAAVPVVVGAGVGWGVTRQYGPLAERARLGLERALDHLERGEPKPGHALPPRSGGVVGAILDEVRKAIQPPK